MSLSTDCRQGQEVIVIGSPKGLESSVSRGIISAIREIENGKYTIIQTDASINSGNSGGPLISREGYVLGMATLKMSGFGIEGLSFCISSQHIKDASDFSVDPDRYRRNLDYTKHSATGRYFVKVIDSSSGEVIREVPPEGQLDRMARIRDLIRKAYSVSDY